MMPARLLDIGSSMPPRPADVPAGGHTSRLSAPTETSPTSPAPTSPLLAVCLSTKLSVFLSVCLSVRGVPLVPRTQIPPGTQAGLFPPEGRRPLYRGVKKDQPGETKKQCVRAAHKKTSSTPGTLGPAAAKLAYRRPYGRRRASGLHMFLIQLVLLLLCYTTRADVESVDSRYAANTRAFGERRGTTGFPSPVSASLPSGPKAQTY